MSIGQSAPAAKAGWLRIRMAGRPRLIIILCMAWLAFVLIVNQDRKSVV